MAAISTNDRQVVVKRQKARELRDYIGARQDEIVKAMTKTAQALLPPGRILGLLNVAVTRQPKLLDCTEQSIYFGIQQACECALDFTGKGGQGWLVPFKNGKTGNLEAVFIPGYKGLRLNLIRSGVARKVVARVVYKGDEFNYAYGLQEHLEHKPGPTPADASKVWGEIAYAYAIAWLPEGEPMFVVIDKPSLERIKKSAKGADRKDSLWNTWPDVAAAKSATRRMANLLDVAPDSLIQQTLEVSDAADTDKPIEVELDFTVEAVEPSPTEALKDRLKAERAEKKEEGWEAEVEDSPTEPVPPPQSVPPDEPEFTSTPTPEPELLEKIAATYPEITERLGKMVSAFGSKGVDQGQLESVFGPLEVLDHRGLDHIADFFSALNADKMTWEDIEERVAIQTEGARLVEEGEAE